jgi:tRNA U38,U39,U40 pseudouridine synthase TruA
MCTFTLSIPARTCVVDQEAAMLKLTGETKRGSASRDDKCGVLLSIIFTILYSVFPCSRTDTGVHAIALVACFKTG